ncbi:hypothetical protein B0H14DRAFT_3709244 [Mycena olivaceomarginata]|nr:hypothetical protein B0H14DRAFT_3709244 [Mycena olivaceomarginata]
MPRGRRPLDPDVKQQRREESLRRYNEKNAGKLREAARLRMQRYRATIATSDIFTQRKYSEKAALASERYRDRKREEERAERRAADAIIKRARGIEKDMLRRKHSKPSKIKPPPPPLAQLPPPPTAKPPQAVSKRRALSPIIPTPAPRRATVICMPAVAIVDSSDAESYDEREHHPPELPIWPARTSRPQRCPHCYQEDCYAPDPGHEDRYKHPGPFYAVVCKDWRGVVTSKASRSRMMELYPDAYTWEASPWWTFDRRWTLDCAEYHEHEGERAVADEPICPATPDSREPSSPSTLSESTAWHAPSPAPPFSTEELAHLASFRPGPGPTSSARLTQQFTRVLGPQAAVPGKPPTASPAKRKTTLFAHEVATALHAGGKVILTVEGPGAAVHVVDDSENSLMESELPQHRKFYTT